MADHQALLVDHDDDEGLGFGEEGPEAKKKLRHPFVAFFHVFFRVSAIFVYLLCGFTNVGFIPSFVSIVVLLSLDFWTVKNITGRIMVGLRWWNYVDEGGQSHWVFESRKGIRAGGRAPERRVFWVALFVTPVIWFLLFLSTIFTLKLQWTILVVLALSLNMANLYGYVRCKIGHSPGIADATSIFSQGLSNMIIRQTTAAADQTNATGSTQQV